MIDVALREILKADAAVTALVGAGNAARIRPDELTQNETMPAVIYTELSAPRDYTHDGPSGWVASIWQLTCYSDKIDEVRDLAEKIRLALETFGRGVEPVTSIQIDGIFIRTQRTISPQDPRRLRRTDLDVEIQHEEPRPP